MALNSSALAEAVFPAALRPYWERVRSSAIGARLVVGAFWSIAGAMISRGLTLLATVVVARLLGQETYGALGIVQSTVGMFGVFAGFGMGITATKYVAELRERDPTRAGQILGLSGLVALVSGGMMAVALIVLAPWLASAILSASHLTGFLRVSAVILFFSALNGAQTGALAGFEAFRRIAQVNLLIGLTSFPLLVAGAAWGGLDGTVLALGVHQGVNWLVSHLALRREAAKYRVPLGFRGAAKQWPVLWRFSLPAVLSGILVTPVSWVCGALLVNRPGGYAEMGVLSAANQWNSAILFVPNALRQIVLPLLSSLGADSNPGRYWKVLRANLLLNAGVTTLVVLPIIWAAPLIMRGYGAGFERGANTLRLIAAAAVFMAANNVVGSAIASRGKMWVGLAFNAMWAGALISTAALLLRKGMGASGVALAFLIAYVCHTAWQGVYLHLISRPRQT